MFWVIILQEHKSLTHKPYSKWDWMMLQYAMIAGLIQFTLHLVQIPNFAIGKSPPNCDWTSFMLYITHKCYQINQLNVNIYIYIYIYIHM